MHERLGAFVEAGQPLATIHAEARGEIEYALEYASANADMFTLED
jgi:thymidine phosphorylase